MKRQLSFSIDPGIPKDGFLNPFEGLKALVVKALETWAAVADLVFFEETRPGEEADIRFVLSPSEKPSLDSANIDIYAVCNTSPDGTKKTIQLDRYQNWVNSTQHSVAPVGIDLLTVLIHEVGHALGLEHELEGHETSIMYKRYVGPRHGLAPRDIDAISERFGPALSTFELPSPVPKGFDQKRIQFLKNGNETYLFYVGEGLPAHKGAHPLRLLKSRSLRVWEAVDMDPSRLARLVADAGKRNTAAPGTEPNGGEDTTKILPKTHFDCSTSFQVLKTSRRLIIVEQGQTRSYSELSAVPVSWYQPIVSGHKTVDGLGSWKLRDIKLEAFDGRLLAIGRDDNGLVTRTVHPNEAQGPSPDLASEWVFDKANKWKAKVPLSPDDKFELVNLADERALLLSLKNGSLSYRYNQTGASWSKALLLARNVEAFGAATLGPRLICATLKKGARELVVIYYQIDHDDNGLPKLAEERRLRIHLNPSKGQAAAVGSISVLNSGGCMAVAIETGGSILFQEF